jgi:hypothetical protein
VKLGDNDAFRAVDDEGAALRHHRDFPHVDLLVLDEVLLAKTQLHIEGNRKCNAVTNTLDLGVFRISDRVRDVFEGQPAVVRLDGKHLAEHRLKAMVLSLPFRSALLQEFQVGTDLQLNEIGRLDNFAKLTEVNAVCVIATIGHGNSRVD